MYILVLYFIYYTSKFNINTYMVCSLYNGLSLHSEWYIYMFFTHLRWDLFYFTILVFVCTLNYDRCCSYGCLWLHAFVYSHDKMLDMKVVGFACTSTATDNFLIEYLLFLVVVEHVRRYQLN